MRQATPAERTGKTVPQNGRNREPDKEIVGIMLSPICLASKVCVCGKYNNNRRLLQHLRHGAQERRVQPEKGGEYLALGVQILAASELAAAVRGFVGSDGVFLA